MKLIVTINEPTLESALGAVLSISDPHQGIELRIDRFQKLPDLSAVRASTDQMLIVTDRTDGSRPQRLDIPALIAEGVDLIDVEYRDDLDFEMIERHRDRIILSHHDFHSVSDLEPLLESMRRLGCAHTKIAVTPSDFHQNRNLLAHSQPGLTLVGMGERGLYSRILAPFFGSELVFVAPDEGEPGAEGQLSLGRALDIYGTGPLTEWPQIFAVVGDRVGHSLSPGIHNPLFRARGVRAAYGIASVTTFEEVAAAMLADEPFAPAGISVTAPFKEDAFRFARKQKAKIAPNAAETKAVNTLVRMKKGWLADNTDVDGFTSILPAFDSQPAADSHEWHSEGDEDDGFSISLDDVAPDQAVAVLGAGGTARAAVVALMRAGREVVVYNRTLARAQQMEKEFGVRARPLEELPSFNGDLIIDTLPVQMDLTLRPSMTYLRTSYAEGNAAIARARAAGAQVIQPLDLLRA
ncbi:MAG TPA: type I 3-dehydroquinate dehydratase, partial [Thermoanaerobaculia bacterium]|nr:type I 3-dehydroquinate dehydratase [Thermoanaerobaculia bacterium]